MYPGEGPTNYIFTTLNLLDAEHFAGQKEWTEALDKLWNHEDCWRIMYSRGLEDPQHMYVLTEWPLSPVDPAERTAFAWTGLEPMLKDKAESEFLMLTVGGHFEQLDEIHELIIVRGDHRVAEANLMDSMAELCYAAVPVSRRPVLPQHLKRFWEGEYQVDEESWKYAVLCGWVSMEGMLAFKDPTQETFDNPDDWQSYFGNKLSLLQASGAIVQRHLLQLRIWPPQRH